MKDLHVVKVDYYEIHFNNGIILSSYHPQDCCENHYLDMEHLSLDDFKGMKFDLSNDNFFKRIKDYGIELIPTNDHSVKIPGYGYNNGYYNSRLDLVLSDGKDFNKKYDISECQTIKD